MKYELDSIDETTVSLDTYNSDLNLVIDGSKYSAHPLTREGFAFMWAGARATHGAAKGRICFEVKIIEHLDVAHLPSDEPNPHVLRVGFSVDSASLQLGEDPLSYGYGGTGKISTNCQFKDFGPPFMSGDCILAVADIDSDLVQIGFAKNGSFIGWAYKIKKDELKGKPLYPHVLTKNCSFEVNFGQKTEPFFQLPDPVKYYMFVGCLPIEQHIRGSTAPRKTEECEMIMMCGLPGAGKSVWATDFSLKHPDKKYNILGTNNIIDKMKVMGLPRKRNYHGRWEVLIQMSTKCLNTMFAIGSKLRRNYILDQTNVYPTAQRRKMRNFEGFKRIAVVVIPTDIEYKRRCDKRDREEGKEVPDSAVLEMKANFKLPEVSDTFEEVIYTELKRVDAEKLVKQYNEEGKAFTGPSRKIFRPNESYDSKGFEKKRESFNSSKGDGYKNFQSDFTRDPNTYRGDYGRFHSRQHYRGGYNSNFNTRASNESNYRNEREYENNYIKDSYERNHNIQGGYESNYNSRVGYQGHSNFESHVENSDSNCTRGYDASRGNPGTEGNQSWDTHHGSRGGYVGGRGNLRGSGYDRGGRSSYGGNSRGSGYDRGGRSSYDSNSRGNGYDRGGRSSYNSNSRGRGYDRGQGDGYEGNQQRFDDHGTKTEAYGAANNYSTGYAEDRSYKSSNERYRSSYGERENVSQKESYGYNNYTEYKSQNEKSIEAIKSNYNAGENVPQRGYYGYSDYKSENETYGNSISSNYKRGASNNTFQSGNRKGSSTYSQDRNYRVSYDNVANEGASQRRDVYKDMNSPSSYNTRNVPESEGAYSRDYSYGNNMTQSSTDATSNLSQRYSTPSNLTAQGSKTKTRWSSETPQSISTVNSYTAQSYGVPTATPTYNNQPTASVPQQWAANAGQWMQYGQQFPNQYSQ